MHGDHSVIRGAQSPCYSFRSASSITNATRANWIVAALYGTNLVMVELQVTVAPSEPSNNPNKRIAYVCGLRSGYSTVSANTTATNVTAALTNAAWAKRTKVLYSNSSTTAGIGLKVLDYFIMLTHYPTSCPSASPSSNVPTALPSSSSPSSSSPSSAKPSIGKTGKPTVFSSSKPSSTPSSAKPTRSSFLFDSFDVKSAFSRLASPSPPASSSVSRNTLNFGADSEDAYTQFAIAFANFINTNVRSSSFPVVYTKVELISYSVVYGSTSAISISRRCDDTNILAALMSAILIQKDFNGTCNGIPWLYSSGGSRPSRRSLQASNDVGIICAGCRSFDNFCQNVSNNVAFGSKTPCYANGYLIKSVGSLVIHQRPAVPKTVPEVINITATAGPTNATVVIKMRAYAPGGQVYCAASSVLTHH